LIVVGSGHDLEDLGLDADVYYHEYGHAVLDKVKPGFFESLESNYSSAFHEGFGDISAAAITHNALLGEFSLRLRSNHRFIGRNLNNHNRFPKDVIRPFLNRSEPHYTGLIVGGAWWDLQKKIGPDAAQKILYNALRLIPDEMNFFDFRDAMLTADRKLNHGSNATAIHDAFARHGLGGDDPGQTGTVTILSLKTAVYRNNRFQFKSTFKKGDSIYVLANYSGSQLTPAYNLIPETWKLDTPKNSNTFSF